MKLSTALASFTLLACLFNQNALAHLKTDIVTLYNGDRVTGELKSLYGGRLHHKTDSMGTISIEWQEIASIQSNYHYEVRTSDGLRLFGVCWQVSHTQTDCQRQNRRPKIKN